MRSFTNWQTIRRGVVMTGAALALLSPAAAANLQPEVGGVSPASPLPLDKSVTANVGTVHLSLGPAGQKDVPVAALATLRLHVDGNPMFVSASPVSCPAGEVGALVKVVTDGGPANVAVSVTKADTQLANQPISIPAVYTGLIGACADVSAG
jgi:hypothetical protein